MIEDLRNIFQVHCEFDVFGEPAPDSACIYCYNDRVKVYSINEDLYGAIFLKVKNVEKLFEEANIPIFDCWGECGEYSLQFNAVDIEKVARLLSFRTTSRPRAIYSREWLSKATRFNSKLRV